MSTGLSRVVLAAAALLLAAGAAAACTPAPTEVPPPSQSDVGFADTWAGMNPTERTWMCEDYAAVGWDTTKAHVGAEFVTALHTKCDTTTTKETDR